MIVLIPDHFLSIYFETTLQSISDRLREKEKEETIDERNKCPNNPHRHLLKLSWHLPYYYLN